MKRTQNTTIAEENKKSDFKTEEYLETRVRVFFSDLEVKADYLFAANITFNIYNVFLRLPVYAGASPEQLYNHCESFTMLKENGVDLR
jgi:hypothetical protein